MRASRIHREQLKLASTDAAFDQNRTPPKIQKQVARNSRCSRTGYTNGEVRTLAGPQDSHWRCTAPLEPLTYEGFAIVGVCLIGMAQLAIQVGCRRNGEPAGTPSY
jgi:hypothetical protein